MSVQRGEEHRKHPRPRLETLSDLIYGLSLSIGAISLVITNNQASTANDINRNVFEFLFVFLILITSWIIYTSDMSVLPGRDTSRNIPERDIADPRRDLPLSLRSGNVPLQHDGRPGLRVNPVHNRLCRNPADPGGIRAPDRTGGEAIR